MINKEAYNFKKENESVFRLQARNLVTNELVDTNVLLFTEDVSLAAKVDLATQAIGEIAKAEEKPDIADIKSAREEMLSNVDVSDKDKIFTLLALQDELNYLKNITNKAISVFDDIFEEGAFNSVVKARYGKIITPNLVFVIELLGIISQAATALSANELQGRIEKMKKRLNDNV